MFTIEEFLRISNQMRDYYAKKIKDSFQEFNFSPNEISILIILKTKSLLYDFLVTLSPILKSI